MFRRPAPFGRTTTLACVALLGALGAAALGACGATSTSTPATTAAVSPKARFIEQANAICRDMKVRGDALTAPVATANDPAVLPRVLQQMNDLVAENVARLRALPPPPGDETTVRALIDGLAQTGSDTVVLARSAETNDSAVMTSAAQAQAASQKKSDREMTAYGLTDCVFGS